jgi:ABC-type transport system involved in cytochrome c biogenesis ATPase subunit
MRKISDFIGMVKAKQAEIAASLAAGNAADWESYHRMVGHNAGLQEALDVLDNLMKEENANE